MASLVVLAFGYLQTRKRTEELFNNAIRRKLRLDVIGRAVLEFLNVVLSVGEDSVQRK